VDNIPDIPKDKTGRSTICVRRIEASHFDPGRAYVSFDGHRQDNFMTHIYRTNDYGKTWEPIKGDPPEDLVVRVIIEDTKNPSLLFIGTDRGVYTSIDGRKH
jgi:hypothetical protein